MNDLFSEGRIVETFTAQQVVAWTKGVGESRLFLPPIQRSVVWRNTQVINYWDSLLRGYPAGMMMVHRSRRIARTLDGQTLGSGTADFDLFDGQQRLSAILLGHGEGQLTGRLQLWVDFGVAPAADSGLLFQLRVNSTGQPFGYQAAWANEKPSLGQRSAKIEAWKKTKNLSIFDPEEAFREVRGKDLIGAQCAFPLAKAIALLSAEGECDRSEAIFRECPDAEPSKVESFVKALGSALNRPIIFQLVDQAIIEKEDEYVRFFGRLGQGGTPLSDEELTYSIIKHQYPEVHDRMKEIMMDRSAGRMASEVNLVLGALRVANLLSGWDGDGKEWKVIGRPNPSSVTGLKELPNVRSEFQKMLPPDRKGRLLALLQAIRHRIAYDESANPGGLPTMLLTRLPHPLVDVLILLQSQASQNPSSRSGPDLLPQFVLHWLLFVSDSNKAAWLVFQRHRSASTSGLTLSLSDLVRDFEKADIAWLLPHKDELIALRAEITAGTHHLRSWGERFLSLDGDDSRMTGGTLRMLSTDRERIKRVLLWLQRGYLTETYPKFDPTSNRDEDLPIDLDHLIPGVKVWVSLEIERLMYSA